MKQNRAKLCTACCNPLYLKSSYDVLPFQGLTSLELKYCHWRKMIAAKLICVIAFESFSTALQFVQVGERLAPDIEELPVVEILDSTDKSLCTISNSYHNFTSNKNGIAGVTIGKFLLDKY